MEKKYIENINYADIGSLAAVGRFIDMGLNVGQSLYYLINNDKDLLLKKVKEKFDDDKVSIVSRKINSILSKTSFGTDDKMTISFEDYDHNFEIDILNIHLDNKDVDYKLSLWYNPGSKSGNHFKVSQGNIAEEYFVRNQDTLKKSYDIYTNPENGNLYSRNYKIDNGVAFELKNGCDAYHDFLFVRIDYPLEIADNLRSNDQRINGIPVLSSETEDKIKDLFLNLSFPVKGEDIANILSLATPDGCTLDQCYQVYIAFGKESREEDELGDSHCVWKELDEIKYRYGNRITFGRFPKLPSNLDNIDVVDAVVNGSEVADENKRMVKA